MSVEVIEARNLRQCLNNPTESIETAALEAVGLSVAACLEPQIRWLWARS